MADKGGYIGRSPGDSAVIIARQNYSPTGIQTDFTFNSGYTPGYVDVYLNGVRLIDVQDYTASTGNTVGLTSYANNGDIVEVIAYKAFNVGNVSDATSNFTVGGNLVVSGDTNVSGSSTFVDVNISGATTASGASYLSNVTEFVSSGIVTVSNTTDSTSTTTGALLVNGGVGVALSMHVGGNLSVGGTLTYEDVTNVDAIGIVTAQSGVNIVGGGLTVTGVGTFFSDVYIPTFVTHLGDTNTKLGFEGPDIITAYTGGSERLRVNSSGQVVIGDSGSASPSGILHLYQSSNDPYIYIQRGSGDASNAIGGIIWKNNTNNLGQIVVNSDDINDGNMVFKTMNNGTLTEALRIDKDGKVGIGSASPTYALEVDGGTQNTVIVARSSDAKAAISFVDNTSGGYGRATIGGEGDEVYITTGAGVERLLIDSDGKVGINSTSPATTLDVHGDISVAYNATHALRFYTLPKNNWSSISNTATDGNANLSIKVSQGEAINITYSKMVGIGTDNPDSKLAVYSASAGSVSADADANELTLENSGNVGLSLLTAGTGESSIYFGNPGTGGQKDGYIKYYHESHSTTANRRSLIFGTGGHSERMRITSEGKVQIDRTVSSTTGNHPALEVETICSGSEDTAFGTGIDFKVDGVAKKRLAVTDGTGEGGGDWVFYKDNGANEALRIDANGRLLIGPTNVGRTLWGASPKLQIETQGADSSFSLIRNQASTGGPWIALAKSRGTSAGATTIVQSGDSLGSIDWFAADGVDYSNVSAEIRVEVDGTPGADDVPGRMIFKTTPDGSSTLSERMRIRANGQVAINKSDGAYLELTRTSTSTTGVCGKIIFGNTDWDSSLAAIQGYQDGHNDSGNLRFYTQPSGGSAQERLRIDQLGAITVGARDSIHSTSALARFGIDCQGLNALSDVADSSKYGLAFYNDPTTDTANGIAFFNDDGSTCGGYILHQDKGSGNLGDLLFGTSAASDTPVEHIRIKANGQLLYSAASGDNTITSKRTNAAGSNGNYFFHLTATDNNDNAVGSLGFHRYSAVDDSAFKVYTRNTGGTNTQRLMIHSTVSTLDTYLQVFQDQSDAQYDGINYSFHKFQSSNNNWTLGIENSHDSAPYGLLIKYSDAAPDNTENTPLMFADNSTTRFKVTGAGDVWTSDDGTLTSDQTLKENITDATSKLEDIKKLKVRNFNWKSSYHPEKSKKKQIGFIAQEVEQVFPALVTESDISPDAGDMDHTPIMKKGIKAAWDPIIIKALQELITKVETLETKVAALESS